MRVEQLFALVLVVGIMAAPTSGPGVVEDPGFGFLAPTSELTFDLSLLDKQKKVSDLEDMAIGRPAVSPDGERIAFTAALGDGDMGRYGIFVVNRDGSGLTQLTDTNGGDFDPAWSPNGKKIAFSRDPAGELVAQDCCNIHTMLADGTGVKKVSNTVGGINPSWSPDGGSLIFETPNGLYTIAANGTGRSKVAPAGSSQPDWSPAGDKIAYVRSTLSNPPEDELVVLDLDNGKKSVWYSPSSRVESPNWQGGSIAVVTYQGYGYDDRSAAKLRVIRPTGAVSVEYSGSPQMVFLASQRSQCRGFKANFSGGSDAVVGIDGPGDCMGRSVVIGDFDNDGVGDLAVGSPGDLGVGSVTVFWGQGGSGPTTSGETRVDQDTAGIPGSPQFDDRFGAALAAGDFNDDGFEDLAIGVPGEDVGGAVDSGGVLMIPGSASGLDTSAEIWITQDQPGVPGSSQTGDLFGSSLAFGDVDNDGRDDLAIGVPGEGLSGEDGAGGVLLLFGEPGSLSLSGEQWIHQNVAGMPGDNEEDDRFGEAVAFGDITGDGFDDLVVGIPGEDKSSGADAGSIAVIPGSSSGVDLAGSQRITQDSTGFKGVSEPGDRYGFSLAVGNFNDDSFADLAVGVPGESIVSADGSGSVNVLHGSAQGVSPDGDLVIHQDSIGIGGAAEVGDSFGYSLAAADFNRDGRIDLVAGIPGEDVAGKANVGGIVVIYSSSTGLATTDSQRFGQATPGVPGGDAPYDLFGFSVAVGDMDGNGIGDVAVGAPGEDETGAADSGAITGLFGLTSGLSSTGSFRFTQGS